MFCKKSIQVAMFLGMSASSLVVQANVDDFYIVPFGSYLHPDEDTEAFDGFGGGLAIGKEINDQFNIEVRGFWQRYENDYTCCKKKSRDQFARGFGVNGWHCRRAVVFDARYIFTLCCCGSRWHEYTLSNG